MNRGNWTTVALTGLFAFTAALPAAAQEDAVIKGKVAFDGDASAAKYKRRAIDTSKDANCKKGKKRIGTYNVILNKKTDPVTVRNVLVYVKEGLGDRKYDVPSEPVTLTQKGCEYKPHVFGIIEGQTLTVTNGDETSHNIHFQPKVNQELNFSQPKKGMTKELKLVAEDTFKVKCDVHPWMGAYVQVFTHPFFDVTGNKGTFELKGLPPGSYVVEAWHETFGTKTMTVEVASDQTAEANFTYKPD